VHVVKAAYYRLGGLTAIVDVNGSASAALESWAGVTVHQCLRAAGELAADRIAARIIDLYSVKPADQATLQAAASATGGRLVIAEDRYLRAASVQPCSRPSP
jgi:transketolase C-terminal domain/subunit